MKLKLATLREPLNFGPFAGVVSLGSGQSRGVGSGSPVKEELELQDNGLVKVTRKEVTLYIPIQNFRYLEKAPD